MYICATLEQMGLKEEEGQVFSLSAPEPSLQLGMLGCWGHCVVCPISPGLSLEALLFSVSYHWPLSAAQPHSLPSEVRHNNNYHWHLLILG